jgi:predicted O-methyltransferase YrrM
MKLSVESELILDASQSLNELAKAVSRMGDTTTADMLIEQAANLEFASPELQNCWGGPFNAQNGRQALVLDLLRIVGPLAAIETGAFRGITTEWLAHNFSGPVLTCEKERLYYLQSNARLRRFPNVTVHLEDSRVFLSKTLATLPSDAAVLIYLDAHWEHDLPLPEELRIIFNRHRKAVVLIDDFKVPDDAGYRWDDYGPDMVLNVDLLAGAIPPNYQIFFPSLHSSEETGKIRGCCVIASDAPSRLGESPLLRGNTLDHWTRVEKQTVRPKSESAIEVTGGQDPDSGAETDRPYVPPSVLRLQLAEYKKDRRQYLSDITSITADAGRFQSQLAESERDRAQRLSDVASLTTEVRQLQTRLANCEEDRLSDVVNLTREVEQLQARLADCEGDRAQRLSDVLTLTAEIQRLRRNG